MQILNEELHPSETASEALYVPQVRGLERVDVLLGDLLALGDGQGGPSLASEVRLQHRLGVGHARVGHEGGHGVEGVASGAGAPQVWSLTQFYSVDFTQSRIVKKCVFNKCTIKVFVSCS